MLSSFLLSLRRLLFPVWVSDEASVEENSRGSGVVEGGGGFRRVGSISEGEKSFSVGAVEGKRIQMISFELEKVNFEVRLT